MVAEPPRFAQKISEITIGTGSKDNSCANSSVTVARNRITVMESMNMDNTKDISMNTTKIRRGL